MAGETGATLDLWLVDALGVRVYSQYMDIHTAAEIVYGTPKPEPQPPFACDTCGDTFHDGIDAGGHEVTTGHRVSWAA